MTSHRNHLRLLVGGLLLLATLCAAFLGLRRFPARAAGDDRYQTMRGWQQISGRWIESNGVFSNSKYGRGDMLIAQRSEGTDYAISADIRFDLLFPETRYGDAGLVIRTTDPSQGVDSYQGYYAGIRPLDQMLILGRASYEWHQLANKPLAAPVSVGTWYHFEVTARACRLSVTAAPVGPGVPTQLDFEDPQCLRHGVAGLRSFYAQASWRNVRVNPL